MRSQENFHNEEENVKKRRDESKLLTIIIPCYNAEKYIRRCIRSLEGLDSRRISVLFINDGSTDSTREIICEWKERHNCATIVDKKNGGYCSAINTGLDCASSKYVMFLGADDEISSSGINTLCTHLELNQPDILFFQTKKIFDDRNKMGVIDELTVYEKQGVYCGDIYSLCKERDKDTKILFWRDTSRCFKRSLVGKTRYYGKIGVSADGVFSTIMACKATSFEFVNEQCYYWHLRNDSVSAKTKDEHRLLDELNVWKTFFMNLEKLGLSQGMPDMIAHHLLSYYQAIYMIKKLGVEHVAKTYERNANRIKKRIINNFSIEYRLKLRFQKCYFFGVSCKRSLKEKRYALMLDRNTNK